MYSVEFSSHALDHVSRLDKAVSDRIIKKIEWLAAHFDAIIPQPLKGKFSRYLQAYGLRLEGALYGEQYSEDHYRSSRGTPKRNLQILRHSTMLIKPRFPMSYRLFRITNND